MKAFRSASLPILTIACMTAGALLTGSAQAQVSRLDTYSMTQPMQLDLIKFSAKLPTPDGDTPQAVAAQLPVEPVLHASIPPMITRPNLGVQVMVHGVSETLMNEGFQAIFSARDIETSAGTFGDPSRFFSTLPGVMTDNDQRNDFLVRGGNPAENSFVIDNIEIPSINQLALSDTTGGMFSMVDANAIQQITLHDDAYSSRFDQRLSSVVEIATRTNGRIEPHTITEAGIAGVGGSIARPLGKDGSYFVSARQGVLQYMTDNIGMNGVPKYRNALIRAENRIDDRNSWWGLSLTGIDSIDIHPDPADPDETTPYDITYSGWRNTTGLNWEHLFSSHAYGVSSFSHSEQSQSIVDNNQLASEALVYNEQSRDSISTLKYDWSFVPSERYTLQTGVRSSIDQMNYNVAQPIGLQNPYTTNPAPQNVGGINRDFSAVTNAAYAEGMIRLQHGIQISGGERFTQWSFGGHDALTAKALVSMPIFGKEVHVSYAEHAQLPAQLYMLAYNNADTLKPIRSRQATAGFVPVDNQYLRLKVEGYQKWYYDYPVATNYPQLSMANIADTFGQAFLMFPMTGNGTGLARGVEVSAETQLGSRLKLTTTAAYARSWYAGLDGVLRRGNYDIPASMNVTGVWTMRRNLVLSWRYNMASGRPYTPDNIPLSIAQNRDVYNLSELNSARSNIYERLDFRFEQTHNIGHGKLIWWGGLENATDHQNFYSQLWEPRSEGTAPTAAKLPQYLQKYPNGFIGVQDQMPLFPDGGMKLVF